MTDQITFETALSTFMNGCQKLVDEAELAFDTRIEIGGGRKYVRLVRRDYTNTGERISSSAYCFVDTTNGNVLKAAGWKAPAKGARGNIFNEDFGLGRMSWTGTAYNR